VIGEHIYRQLVELSFDGIWVLDASTRTTFVNPAMATILGYAPEEMLGRHLFDFMDEAGVALARGYLHRRLHGIAEEIDFELIRKDGSRVPTRLSTGPILDGAGAYAGAAAFVRDVSRHRELERREREHAEQLRAFALELEKARDQERRLIATGLHDEIGQNLAFAKIELGRLRRAFPTDEIARRTDGIRDALDAAIALSRSMVSELSPPVLSELGLVAATRDLADRIGARSGLAVTVQAPEHDPPLAAECAPLLYSARQSRGGAGLGSRRAYSGAGSLGSIPSNPWKCLRLNVTMRLRSSSRITATCARS
jgi:PAS domain S-box-containing protein